MRKHSHHTELLDLSPSVQGLVLPQFLDALASLESTQVAQWVGG